jgi:ATPase family protein associated with various cellular activities (AAA)
VDFDALRAKRKALNNAVLRHGTSLNAFRAEDWAWFKLTVDEELDSADKDTARHLSTSASCIESIFDINQPDAVKAVGIDLPALVNDFSDRALHRSKWQSDEAAEVYCRVRTLPIILRYADDLTLSPHLNAVTKHIRFVWNQLVPRDPDAHGIAEKAAPGSDLKSGRQYPPNAFHTYWALRLLREHERRSVALDLPALPKTLPVKRSIALLWCNRTLATQTSLVQASADRLDAQQLAWALLADYEGSQLSSSESVEPATATNERRELYEAGLEAFFSEQSEESGAWPLYEPLFHYPGAGNAYCYTFETLAELLRPALQWEDGRLLRDLLRPHLASLMRAHSLAERTAIPLPGGGLGWSSGHHPHRQEPEAWATASVLSYLQALRRLVGYWTSQVAKQELGCRKPRYADRAEAEETLRERGMTWTDRSDRFTVGRELAGLFVHPRQAGSGDREAVDPDAPLIDPSEARSAILFGPPGTGKTTLVEAVAGAIDWEFVEVPASAFVSAGIDQVPARAELIFSQLMELDRVVILFDEVDELIRERTRKDSDPLGRFLTTSMLPKLAKLWDQRRVLFFVATNSVDIADPAIRRSQRFDASIFAAPPSFAQKYTRFAERLGEPPPKELTYSLVNENLKKAKLTEGIGVYGLLRWDQIPELAGRLLGKSEISLPFLQEVLREMGKELSRLEYHDESKKTDILEVWNRYWDEARRDYGRSIIVRVDDPPNPIPDSWHVVSEKNGSAFLDLEKIGIGNLTLDPATDSCLLDLDGITLHDRGTLDFRES